MRCEFIVVKSFSGTALVRKLWEISDCLVLIHDSAEFEKRMNGEDHLGPVGFTMPDVYEYDEQALSTSDPWKALKPIGTDR